MSGNEAETHYQEHRFGLPKEREEKNTNVLLLSLSTFPQPPKDSEQSKIRCTDFEFSIKSLNSDSKNNIEGTVKGRYQLDPVPKMLDILLAEKNENLDKKKENLDKIIMLCTKEAKEKKKIITPEGEERDTTPEEYFKKQVTNYMNPAIEEGRFVSIDVSLDKPYEGIEGVLNEIRKITNPHIYLDTHGGIRGIQRILEATVSLLRTEGIEIKRAFSVEFNPKSKIIDETDNVKIFDFTSGINEFISCGRADVLLNYKENMHIHNKLIDAIHAVAEGIQWCNIPRFKDGLDSLYEVYHDDGRAQSESDGIAQSYLDLYKNTIKKDYGNLTEHHTPADEIHWCIDKGFFQQALTLIESKISSLLVNDWKVLSVNRAYKKVVVKENEEDKDKYTVNTKAKNDKYEEIDVNFKVQLNELFNAVVYKIKRAQVYNIKDKDAYKALILDKDAINNMEKSDYKNFAQYIDQHVGRKKNDERTVIKNALRNASVRTNVVQIIQTNPSEEKLLGTLPVKRCLFLREKLGDEQVKTLFNILVVHATLKDVRNTSNHAVTGEKYKPEKVKYALDYYMEQINKLNPNSDKL